MTNEAVIKVSPYATKRGMPTFDDLCLDLATTIAALAQNYVKGTGRDSVSYIPEKEYYVLAYSYVGRGTSKPVPLNMILPKSTILTNAEPTILGYWAGVLLNEIMEHAGIDWRKDYS